MSVCQMRKKAAAAAELGDERGIWKPDGVNVKPFITRIDDVPRSVRRRRSLRHFNSTRHAGGRKMSNVHAGFLFYSPSSKRCKSNEPACAISRG